MDAEIVKLTEDEAAQNKDQRRHQAPRSRPRPQKVAANKEQLDDIRDKTAKIGDIKELATKMRDLNAELEQLGQSITDNEAKLANLTAENTQAETQANRAASVKFDTIASGQSLPTLNTRIRSIYPTWGFVTLAAGNNGGVVANSTLDVVRDGPNHRQAARHRRRIHHLLRQHRARLDRRRTSPSWWVTAWFPPRAASPPRPKLIQHQLSPTPDSTETP